MIVTLPSNLAPLYFLIGPGYICGRWLEVNLHALATVAIFVLSPVVMFGAITQTDFRSACLLLPPVIFVLCCAISASACRLSYTHFRDKTANLIGMAAGGQPGRLCRIP